MSVSDRADFPFDARMISWDQCLQGFTFGIRRYFMREDILSPPCDSGYNQILMKNQIGWFYDVRVASRSAPKLKAKNLESLFERILNNKSFNRYFQTR